MRLSRHPASWGQASSSCLVTRCCKASKLLCIRSLSYKKTERFRWTQLEKKTEGFRWIWTIIIFRVPSSGNWIMSLALTAMETPGWEWRCCMCTTSSSLSKKFWQHCAAEETKSPSPNLIGLGHRGFPVDSCILVMPVYHPSSVMFYQCDGHNMFAATLTLRRVWLQVDMKIDKVDAITPINILFIGSGEFWSLLKIGVANFDPSWRYSWCDSPHQHIVQRGWKMLTPHEDKVDVITPVNILFRAGGEF